MKETSENLVSPVTASLFHSFILSNAYSHFNSGSICNIDLVKIGAEAEGIFEAGVNDIKELDLDGHGTDI